MESQKFSSLIQDKSFVNLSDLASDTAIRKCLWVKMYEKVQLLIASWSYTLGLSPVGNLHTRQPITRKEINKPIRPLGRPAKIETEPEEPKRIVEEVVINPNTLPRQPWQDKDIDELTDEDRKQKRAYYMAMSKRSAYSVSHPDANQNVAQST